MAKLLDSNALNRLVSWISTKLFNKVDKETGKGLSSNDFTNSEKSKVNDSVDTLSATTYSNKISMHGTKHSGARTTSDIYGATSAAAGLLTAADKSKLDSVEAGAVRQSGLEVLHDFPTARLAPGIYELQLSETVYLNNDYYITTGSHLVVSSASALVIYSSDINQTQWASWTGTEYQIFTSLNEGLWKIGMSEWQYHANQVGFNIGTLEGDFETFPLNSATTTTAGVMSSIDKATLNELPGQVQNIETSITALEEDVKTKMNTDISSLQLGDYEIVHNTVDGSLDINYVGV